MQFSEPLPVSSKRKTTKMIIYGRQKPVNDASRWILLFQLTHLSLPPIVGKSKFCDVTTVALSYVIVFLHFRDSLSFDWADLFPLF